VIKITLSTFIAFIFLSSCSLLDKLPKTSGVKPEKNWFKTSFIKNLDPNYESGNLPIALHGPLVYRDMVFVGSNNGVMNAYAKDNGRLKDFLDATFALESLCTQSILMRP